MVVRYIYLMRCVLFSTFVNGLHHKYMKKKSDEIPTSENYIFISLYYHYCSRDWSVYSEMPKLCVHLS